MLHMQVATLHDVQSFGLKGRQTPASFLATLAATELQEPFYNAQSLIDLEILYKFVEQACRPAACLPPLLLQCQTGTPMAACMC